MLNNKKLEGNIGIFMMTHKEKCDYIGDWVIPLQTGDGFEHGIILEDLCHNTGDNIADKTDNYGEFTGLYWVWKNTNYNIIGQYHYRRKFDLNPEQIQNLLKDHDIIYSKEAIMPLTVEETYLYWVVKEDWEIMKNLLKSEYPDYYVTSERVFKEYKGYYWDIFITRKEIFDKFCAWLFPFLFKLETLIDLPNRTGYQSRTIAFIAERLFSLYIKHNKLKVAEVEMLFATKIGEKKKWIVDLQSSFEKTIQNINLKNKNIVIFAYTDFTKRIIAFLEQMNIAVSAIVDNNKKLQEEIYKGIKVYKPEDYLIPFNENNIILIASRFYREMKEQLEKYGYQEGRHIIHIK